MVLYDFLWNIENVWFNSILSWIIERCLRCWVLSGDG